MELINGVFVIPGPVWNDGCNHPKGSYIASFETAGEKHDLYVWDQPTFGSSVCIRYGDDDGEYAGITSLIELSAGAQCGMAYYRDALALIRHYGKIVWKRN